VRGAELRRFGLEGSVTERRIDDVPAEWNRLTEQVIGAAMEVHSTLGPGLLERLYENALCVELGLRNISFERQAPIRMSYKGTDIGDQVMDLVVGGVLILELKAIERVNDVHLAQLVSYLRSSTLPLGLLINFNVTRLKDGIFRRVNNTRTSPPNGFLTRHSSPRPSASSAFIHSGGDEQ
jgi:GxxExxY protein